MAANDDDMLWQPGTVVTVKPDHLIISFEPLSQCQRCLSGQGCGAGVFGRLFPSRSTLLNLNSRQAFKPGQRVRVGLRPAQLLRAALVLYGLPLLGFLLGLVVGHGFLRDQPFGELFTLLLGLAFGAGLLLVFRTRNLALNPTVQALSCNAEAPTLESGSD